MPFYIPNSNSFMFMDLNDLRTFSIFSNYYSFGNLGFWLTENKYRDVSANSVRSYEMQHDPFFPWMHNVIIGCHLILHMFNYIFKGRHKDIRQCSAKSGFIQNGWIQISWSFIELIRNFLKERNTQIKISNCL